jgi:uncharacterized zinc-type alcohol dehydrogenase-like protein
MATIKDGTGTIALAAYDATAALQAWELGRPAPGPAEVSIAIKFCGMCHSDLHACNNDWEIDTFPLVPGHEIAGIVQTAGDDSKFKVGDRVCVGVFVDSCGSCSTCERGLQNYCRQVKETYASTWAIGRGHDECAGYHTNGGYSSQITVQDAFVFRIPDDLALEYAGPLACAGITMFSPLNRHVLKQQGKKAVAIVGFGGLGQIGAKIAKAMGADVTFLSRSMSKQKEAAALGANILAHSDKAALEAAADSFDVIIDTVSVPHDVSSLIPTLKVGGTLVTIGVILAPIAIASDLLIGSNYKIEGSLVGGLPETQEMFDFCYKHGIKPDIKVIKASEASQQFKALANGTASIERAVIDMSTLAEL